MFNYVLVLLFALINIITSDTWWYYYSSLASMQCWWDSSWRNNWDGDHDNVQYGAFIAGMESEHSNSREDRRFKWKYCKPSGGSSPMKSTAKLSETSYDAKFDRDCSSRYGGNSALIGGTSYHNNGKEDRRWTFYCGDLSNFHFKPGACEWSDYVNSWDKKVDYECPSNCVMRGISSYHDNKREDRRWRFECCIIFKGSSSSAQANQEMVDINDYVFGETSESQNRGFWIMALISAGLCISCMSFGVYFYRQKNKSNAISIHKYSSNLDEEEVDELI